jgi:hypothetical protein
MDCECWIDARVEQLAHFQIGSHARPICSHNEFGQVQLAWKSDQSLEETLKILESVFLEGPIQDPTFSYLVEFVIAPGAGKGRKQFEDEKGARLPQLEGNFSWE